MFFYLIIIAISASTNGGLTIPEKFETLQACIDYGNNVNNLTNFKLEYKCLPLADKQ